MKIPEIELKERVDDDYVKLFLGLLDFEDWTLSFFSPGYNWMETVFQLERTDFRSVFKERLPYLLATADLVVFSYNERLRHCATSPIHLNPGGYIKLEREGPKIALGEEVLEILKGRGSLMAEWLSLQGDDSLTMYRSIEVIDPLDGPGFYIARKTDDSFDLLGVMIAACDIRVLEFVEEKFFIDNDEGKKFQGNLIIDGFNWVPLTSGQEADLTMTMWGSS